MALRLMKRFLAWATGRPRAPGHARGEQKAAGYYDAMYSQSTSYQAPYHQSHYYFIWSVIADRVRRDGLRRVFEVGCGPAQLATYLFDQGIENYIGFDFSPTAVEIARKQLPRGEVFVGSALDADAYTRAQGADVLLCTEVLEHIEGDLTVLSRFPAGLRCICTVPNFPYDSHVRHFKDADEVRARYAPFFSEMDVMTLRSPRGTNDMFFLFDGVRNEYRVADAV